MKGTWYSRYIYYEVITNHDALLYANANSEHVNAISVVDRHK